MSRKTFEGTVTSNKMEKTLVVSVTRKYRESTVGKILSTRKKYKVHCETPSVNIGDRVLIEECRPMSKDKKFRFLEVTRKSEAVHETNLEA